MIEHLSLTTHTNKTRNRDEQYQTSKANKQIRSSNGTKSTSSNNHGLVTRLQNLLTTTIQRATQYENGKLHEDRLDTVKNNYLNTHSYHKLTALKEHGAKHTELHGANRRRMKQAAERRQQAHILRALNQDADSIADNLGLSTSTVQTYQRETTTPLPTTVHAQDKHRALYDQQTLQQQTIQQHQPAQITKNGANTLVQPRAKRDLPDEHIALDTFHPSYQPQPLG